MTPKPNPSDFTHNGILQQPHYDNAVRAWEKLEGMDEVKKAAVHHLIHTGSSDNGGFISRKIKEAFEAGAEWQKQQQDKLMPILVDLVWNTVTESEEVPSTQWSKLIIEKAISLSIQ